MLDGTHVKAYRVASDPPIFSLTVQDQIKTGLPAGHTVASADGYWAFLKPLTVGYHDIYFHGECSGGTRNSSASYEITIFNDNTLIFRILSVMPIFIRDVLFIDLVSE